MYFRIIIFLALVATISLGINWLVVNDGELEFIWLGYSVKTSVSFSIFVISFIIFLFVVIIQLLITVITIPKRIGKNYQSYIMEQNLKNLQIGYAALLSGDYDQAKKQSQKLLKSPTKNKSLTNLSEMLTAKVAQEEGNTAVANDYFNKFLDNKNQKFFAVKSLLDTSFQQGNIDEALKYAEQAYDIKPNVKDGARSLLELYKKAERFLDAENFLNKYRKRHRFFKDKYNNIDVEKELGFIWSNRAKEIHNNDKNININDEKDIKESRKYAEKAFKTEPNNKENIMLLLRIYKRLKQENRAKRLIEKIWNEMQSIELGLAYLNVFSGADQKITNKKKLKAIDGLSKLNSNNEIIEKLKDKIYQF